MEISVTASLRPTGSPAWGTRPKMIPRIRFGFIGRTQSASLHEQPAVVIGDERTEQSHKIGNGEPKGSNRKVGPIASVESQGQVKKARIEHERGRQIDQSAHANECGNQRA